MQLARKNEIEGTVVFSSPSVISPLSNADKEELLTSLSSSDALIIGEEEPVDGIQECPKSSLVLDWIDMLGLLDLSGCDRVLLADGADELDELLFALARCAASDKPRIAYSFSGSLVGELPQDVLHRDDEGQWRYARELDDEMLSHALGACLSSKALRCEGILYSLATGTASFASPSREDLSRAVRVLSCGMLEVSPDLFSRWIESWELASFDERLGELAKSHGSVSLVAAQAKALRNVTILEKLLRAAWGSGSGLFDGFTVTREQMLSGFRRSDGEVTETLRANGMESFLDAALSGVPVDDLMS